MLAVAPALVVPGDGRLVGAVPLAGQQVQGLAGVPGVGDQDPHRKLGRVGEQGGHQAGEQRGVGMTGWCEGHCAQGPGQLAAVCVGEGVEQEVLQGGAGCAGSRRPGLGAGDHPDMAVCPGHRVLEVLRCADAQGAGSVRVRAQHRGRRGGGEGGESGGGGGVVGQDQGLGGDRGAGSSGVVRPGGWSQLGRVPECERLGWCWGGGCGQMGAWQGQDRRGFGGDGQRGQQGDRVGGGVEAGCCCGLGWAWLLGCGGGRRGCQACGDGPAVCAGGGGAGHRQQEGPLARGWPGLFDARVEGCGIDGDDQCQFEFAGGQVVPGDGEGGGGRGGAGVHADAGTVEVVAGGQP